MKYLGKDIERLIPQRPPFMMVDGFEPLTDDSATAALSVDRNNYFVILGDELSESGIIEHQAQSVSAMAGYKAAGSDSPPVGIIGEVKHFECLRRPRVGERLVTTVQMGMTFGNVTMARCETAVDGETVARINIKVFMQ